MTDQKIKKTFHIITPVGFENLAKNELLHLWPCAPITKLEKGALCIASEEMEFFRHIPYLKIPTKILMEIDQFICRDIVKFYNKLTKVKWNQFLFGQIPEFAISAKNSRLFDSRKIEDSAKKAISNYYKAQPPQKKYADILESLPPSTIHVRILDDNCTLSIDLSGERLDKRGLKLFTSEAPVRENLASACLQFSFEQIKNQGNEIESIIDPMCGSGTFLFEALMKDLPQKRDFYYKYLSSYKLEKKYVYNYQERITNFIGNEISENTYKGLEKNINAYQSLFTQTLPIQVNLGDATQFIPKSCTNSLLITNPPYGKRVKVEGSTKEYFDELMEIYDKNCAPNYMAFLIPKIIPNPKNKNYRFLDALNFSNGGIDVKLLLWKRK